MAVPVSLAEPSAVACAPVAAFASPDAVAVDSAVESGAVVFEVAGSLAAALVSVWAPVSAEVLPEALDVACVSDVVVTEGWAEGWAAVSPELALAAGAVSVDAALPDWVLMVSVDVVVAESLAVFSCNAGAAVSFAPVVPVEDAPVEDAVASVPEPVPEDAVPSVDAVVSADRKSVV